MSNRNSEAPTAATDEASNLSVTTKELTMKSVAKTNQNYSIFAFDGKDVRVVAKDGEPWFLASDLCNVLGLDATSIRKLDDDEKGLHSMQTLGGTQQVAVISESGMWTLILRCRDAVKSGTVPYRVRKWVTAEVLPSIRKTGSYEKTPKTKKALSGKITTDQQEAIKQLVLTRGKALPKEQQAKAMITMWSALKKHFGATYKQIGSDQFTEALSLAARIPLEGEFIGRETLPSTIDMDSINVALVHAKRLHHNLDIVMELWKEHVLPLNPPIMISGTFMDSLHRASVVVESIERVEHSTNRQ